MEIPEQPSPAIDDHTPAGAAGRIEAAGVAKARAPITAAGGYRIGWRTVP